MHSGWYKRLGLAVLLAIVMGALIVAPAVASDLDKSTYHSNTFTHGTYTAAVSLDLNIMADAAWISIYMWDANWSGTHVYSGSFSPGDSMTLYLDADDFSGCGIKYVWVGWYSDGQWLGNSVYYDSVSWGLPVRCCN